MFSFYFPYPLPYTNHLTGRPDMKIKVYVEVDEFGIAKIIPESTHMVINEERMHRDLWQKAQDEYDRKLYRIARGERILKAIPDDEFADPHKEHSTVRIILLILLIVFPIIHF